MENTFKTVFYKVICSNADKTKFYTQTGCTISNSLSLVTEDIETTFGDNLVSIVELKFVSDKPTYLIPIPETICRQILTEEAGDFNVPCDKDGNPIE